jgi:hypothetical protein
MQENELKKKTSEKKTTIFENTRGHLIVKLNK